MSKIAIIASTDQGLKLGSLIKNQLDNSILVSTRVVEGSEAIRIETIGDFLNENFHSLDSFVFIGALGICVRSIAPFLSRKESDPAVVNMDEMNTFVQSVVGGHIAGANALTLKIAAITGAQPVITTSTDLQGIWNLDTFAKKFNWNLQSNISLNQCISLWANNKPTAILLDIKNEGTIYMEKTKPFFADIFYEASKIDFSKYSLCIAVTYKHYVFPIPSIYFYGKVLSLGIGCSRDTETDLLEASILEQMKIAGLAWESLAQIGSIDVKHDETAIIEFAKKYQIPFKTFSSEMLNAIEVPNPSEIVQEKLGVKSVSEASALMLSANRKLLVEKQKISLASGKKHTFAIALDSKNMRKACIAIVGAGPGDADLISVKGRHLVQEADLVLYAGSLIPEALTVGKKGAIVRNSAGMTLEDQMILMEEHYSKGHLIVRLQSGDPSIYGAIQEQMSLFDEKKMDYFIVPGISSFQAAAAYLQSEFTIPELVQTIILTRGAGNTPLPDHEKISEMARHRATMCIFLSATIAKSIQAQLLEHYPANTPVAILYRVTWEDEEVYTGVLKDLAAIIRQYKLTRTVLIIVGDAIGARKNRSQLYHPEHKHIFRTGKKATLKPKRLSRLKRENNSLNK